MIDFEKDAAKPALASNEQLSQLYALVEQQLQAAKAVEHYSEKLKEAKDQLNRLQRGAVPDMMAQLGYAKLSTVDGHTVEIREGIDATITKANQPVAYKWLRETGNETIIKTKLDTTFDGREVEQLKRAMEVLENAGVRYSISEGVHPQTLKAFVRHELEAGRELPEFVSVYKYNEAKIS